MEDVTLDMRGQLALRINDVLTDQPLNVTIQNIRLDLDALLERGGFRINEQGKAQLVLDGVRLELTVDAGPLLAASSVKLVADAERELL